MLCIFITGSSAVKVYVHEYVPAFPVYVLVCSHSCLLCERKQQLYCLTLMIHPKVNLNENKVVKLDSRQIALDYSLLHFLILIKKVLGYDLLK